MVSSEYVIDEVEKLPDTEWRQPCRWRSQWNCTFATKVLLITIPVPDPCPNTLTWQVLFKFFATPVFSELLDSLCQTSVNFRWNSVNRKLLIFLQTITLFIRCRYTFFTIRDVNYYTNLKKKHTTRICYICIHTHARTHTKYVHDQQPIENPSKRQQNRSLIKSKLK